MPYPPPILVAEPNSFAYYTVTQRLPAICHRIIAENNFLPEIEARLTELAQSLPYGQIIALDAVVPDLSDAADWENYLAPYLGKRWLDLPWYFAEAYFYRRVLAAIDYFHTGIDPYLRQKSLGITNAMALIQQLSAQVNSVQGQWDKTSFVTLVYFALWGNRVDLSLFPANTETRWTLDAHQEHANLLVDDTDSLIEWIASHQGSRMDVIVDNAGFELFCDLCLADYLLTTQISGEVWFHVKAYPVFVSDATHKDIYDTLTMLANAADETVRSLADRLQHHLHQGRLHLQTHPFWTSPLMFWDMPDDLRQQLTASRVIWVKGDANYRRLLGDRHWDFTTPFPEIVAYCPAPLVVLRTLKAELACGLCSSQIERLNVEDPNWLTNGRYGVIQWAVP